MRALEKRYPTTLAQSEEMARSNNKRRSTSELRIIGGQWRSRKLAFVPADGLRPTTDRIRETLFNWLAPIVQGSRCADLFAGSGALGLEALSRGAAHCDFVDTSPTALNQITGHLATLGATSRGACHRGAAEAYLAAASTPLDIVFIDPPFERNLVQGICQLLSTSALLAPEAWVYLETPADQVLPELPGNWVVHRDKVAGGVAYRLLHVTNTLPQHPRPGD